MLDLRTIARALGGEIVGGGVVAPGPGHSAKDRSLSVKPSANSPDGFVLFSHAGDDWRLCRDFVRQALGLPRDGWKTEKPLRIASVCHRPAEIGQREDEKERTAQALKIWNGSRDLRGTLGEVYLRSRGLDLPDQIAAEQFLRWNPELNALIGLFRDVWDARPKAITRIFLTREGRKLKRAFLGPVGSAAVCVDAHGDIMDTLTIGEGVETCLAARQMGFQGVWALGSATGIQALRLLPGVRTLIVLAEYDGGANAHAVSEVSARWRADGRKVLVAYPEIGRDMNDALLGREVA
jgi:hypothetical protein